MTSLKTIWLFNNKLSAVHPKMFSHLSNLKHLDFHWNTCIDELFESYPSKATIENELVGCGAGYAVLEQQNSVKTRFEETKNLEDGEKKVDHHQEKKISEKLENLQNSIYKKLETLDGKFQIIFGKLEHSESAIAGKLENLTTRFGELEKKFDERNEENAKNVREIKRMMERVLAMKISQ